MKSGRPKARGLRQTMSDLHIWSGLLLGWLLYAMFLTGSLSYFRQEITQWMLPEAPPPRSVPDAAQAAQRVVDALGRVAAPGSPQWSIALPDARTPIVSAAWRLPQPEDDLLSAMPTLGPSFVPSNAVPVLAPPTLAPVLAPKPVPGQALNESPEGMPEDTLEDMQEDPLDAAPGLAPDPLREPIVEEARFDAVTGERLAGPAGRETQGGDFFYRFHFQFHYLPLQWGRWLAGLAGMFMLVAIVSGVITHKKFFADFFTFRWGQGLRAWLDAHNALSVLALPFHLMIAYTGLVVMMLTYLPWSPDLAFSNGGRGQLAKQMSAFLSVPPRSHVAAPLAPVAPMVRAAQQRWGAHNVARVIVALPGDAGARVVVARGDEQRVSYSPQYMVFDGRTGRLLAVREAVGPAAETRGVLYALHMGRFADGALRWLYFLLGLAGTAMVGTGLVLWTVKRRARLPEPARPYFGFWLVDRLNIAAIAGLPIGIAAMLGANRLLPLGLAQRAAWEIHILFIAWGAALAWAMGRPAKQAWIELLALAAALLALLPIVNALTTDRPLWASLRAGDWVFAGVELALLAFAALHAGLALRVARHRSKEPKAPPRSASPRPSPPALRDPEPQPTLREAAS